MSSNIRPKGKTAKLCQEVRKLVKMESPKVRKSGRIVQYFDLSSGLSVLLSFGLSMMMMLMLLYHFGKVVGTDIFIGWL